MTLIATTLIPTEAQPSNGLMQITLQVNATQDTSQTVALTPNSTAFAALNQSYTVTYSTSSYGVFVTGINDTTANTTHNWLYFVNGNPASTAADRYTLSDGDTVTFAYLSNNASAALFN